MKKIVCILAMALACILVFAGCQCEHKWDPATCIDPKICQSCGVSEGEALGHSWKPATCNAPKTCEVCKQTEGKALTHVWAEATCAAPKTCTACGLTEGEALAHTWVEADCDSPKTCSVCAATEGAPLGHVWQAATCDTPQTCTVCAAVDGEAPGHSWTDATCDAPKTCSVCKLTEGEALGHKWAAATTEKPKTCTTCGKTEGKKITTDSRFKTDACQKLFGSWESCTEYTAADLGLTNQTGSYSEVTVYTFHNDGTMSISVEIKNLDTAKKLMIASISQEIYAGYDSKEAADSFMQAYFGMTTEEYATTFATTYLEELQDTSIKGVYYVSNDRLYFGDSWSSEMDRYDFLIENKQLRLIDPDGDHLDLTRR